MNFTQSAIRILASNSKAPKYNNVIRVSSLRHKFTSASSDPGDDGWTEIRIPVPWGHIAGKTYGDPNGKPVLAIHGIMDNSGTFDRLMPLLSKSHYFVAIDLPGHGLSSRIPAGIPYHYIDMIVALRRVTNHFKWEKFSWLGHSLGAGAGAVYSSLFPTHFNRYKLLQETKSTSHLQVITDDTLKTLKVTNADHPLVDKLIMIDLVAPLTGVIGSEYPSKVSLGIDQFLAMEEKQAAHKHPPSYTIEKAVDRLIKATSNSLTEETAKCLMKRGAILNAKDGKYSFSRDIMLGSSLILGFTESTTFEILSEIKSPLLFIKAKNSTWYYPKPICQAVLETYKNNCPSFQFEEIEGDHFIHLNTPERIAGVINKFLLEEK